MSKANVTALKNTEENTTVVEMSEPSDNVVMELNGNILTITIDLSQNFGLSSTGKSNIIASTSGNIAIPGTKAKIGLNVYTPITRR